MDKLERLNEDDKFRTDNNVELVRRKEINSARSDGRKEGRKEGANNEKKSIAKNLLKMNLSVKDIMKATGLSKKQITALM